uniref:Probable methyltransferase-like protein 15 n=1 Tax=Phallusia mammillata TaxID=59560 RepID=A0A6F9DJZ2_9ASCI|nr:probable methyltransferase-like protein 15 [Phallusia mammillata]
MLRRKSLAIGLRALHSATSVSAKHPKPLHIPVLLEEVLENLNLNDQSMVLDLTFGAGGHSEEVLKRYSKSHVFALDRDEQAFSLAKEMSAKYSQRLTPMLGKFSELHELLQAAGLSYGEINAAIIDPGCSSMQFDEPGRGFSLAYDGPLDMRMDGNRNTNQPTAADVVNHLSEEEIDMILLKYGDERLSKKIARSIVENRPIHTTKALAEAVGNAFSYRSHMIGTDAIGRRRHAATKTFMALRIFVNDEINELHSGITTVGRYLSDKGRLAIITFHPNEDRLVKQALNVKDFVKLPTCENSETKTLGRNAIWTNLHKGVILPCKAEIQNNTRARSAKLRVAVKNMTTDASVKS